MFDLAGSVPMNGLTKEDLVAEVVAIGIEGEAVVGRTSSLPVRDAPAGQDAGERDDIVLAVAAIDAERVQFISSRA